MTKEKIIIVGTGEWAKVTIENVEEQNLYEIFGLTTFDDDNKNYGKIYGYELVCKDKEIENLIKENKDIKGYVLGVGIGIDGSLLNRKKIYDKLDNFIEPINIIHPSAIISKRASLGKGNIVEAYSKICNDTIIGNHCIIQGFSSVNHDQFIGNNVMINCNVTLSGKKINDHSVISDGSSVGFKKNIGKNCLLMDGSVLTKDMPDDSIGYGNPAKIIKRNKNVMKMLYQKTSVNT